MNKKNKDIVEHSDYLENEKQKLIKLATDKFGEQYFEKLEELTKEYMKDVDTNNFRYSLIINNVGAFNAC